jgi:hypothetical protein
MLHFPIILVIGFLIIDPSVGQILTKENLPNNAPSDCEKRLKELDVAARRLVIAPDDRPGYVHHFKTVKEVESKYCK